MVVDLSYQMMVDFFHAAHLAAHLDISADGLHVPCGFGFVEDLVRKNEKAKERALGSAEIQKSWDLGMIETYQNQPRLEVLWKTVKHMILTIKTSQI